MLQNIYGKELGNVLQWVYGKETKPEYISEAEANALIANKNEILDRRRTQGMARGDKERPRGIGYIGIADNRRPDYDQQTYNKAKTRLDKISSESGGVGTGGRDNIAREMHQNNRVDLRGQRAETRSNIAIISQLNFWRYREFLFYQLERSGVLIINTCS